MWNRPESAWPRLAPSTRLPLPFVTYAGPERQLGTLIPDQSVPRSLRGRNATRATSPAARGTRACTSSRPYRDANRSQSTPEPAAAPCVAAAVAILSPSVVAETRPGVQRRPEASVPVNAVHPEGRPASPTRQDQTGCHRPSPPSAAAAEATATTGATTTSR